MIKKITIVLLIIFIISDTQVFGNEIIGINDFDLSKSQSALKNGGYTNISTDDILIPLSHGDVLKVIELIWEQIKSQTIGNFDLVKEALGNLLIIAIISAFFTNFSSVFSKNTISDTGFYICYLIISSIILLLFNNFCTITSDFVNLLLKFIVGVIPAYFLSLSVIGQASAMGFYEFTLVLIGICNFVFLKVVIPLIKIYITISLVNNISKEEFLSGLTYVIKNSIKFINRTIITLVTGINIIQGLILPSIDNTKNTAIRKVVGTIPVIGDGSDGITSIVFSSVNLIKNTIGTFAIIIIILICLIPFIKVKLYSAFVQIIGAIISPVSDKRIISSLKSFNEGINFLVRVIVTVSLLFIISIAIICFTTGVKN